MAAVVLQGPSGTELGQQLQRLVTERVPGPGHRPPASSDRTGQAGAGESPPPASSEPPPPAGPRSPPEPHHQPGRPPTGCMQLSAGGSLGLSPSPARPLAPPPTRKGGGAAQPSAPLRAPPATRGRRGRGRVKVRAAGGGSPRRRAGEPARGLGPGSRLLQREHLILLRTPALRAAAPMIRKCEPVRVSGALSTPFLRPDANLASLWPLEPRMGPRHLLGCMERRLEGRPHLWGDTSTFLELGKRGLSRKRGPRDVRRPNAGVWSQDLPTKSGCPARW